MSGSNTSQTRTNQAINHSFSVLKAFGSKGLPSPAGGTAIWLQSYLSLKILPLNTPPSYTITANANSAFAAINESGVATNLVAGTASSSFGVMNETGVATTLVEGTASSSFGALNESATAGVVVGCTASSAFEPFSESASGTTLVGASADSVFNTLTAVASVAVAVSAAADIAFIIVIESASGAVLITAIADFSFDALMGTATGESEEAFIGIGDITFGEISEIALGLVAVAGTTAYLFTDLIASAAGGVLISADALAYFSLMSGRATGGVGTFGLPSTKGYLELTELSNKLEQVDIEGATITVTDVCSTKLELVND